ncbi:MAG: carboxylate-amine ligase [Caldilineaceae bacterium]|nr:carboxylate-amine ligase [Caldilineaceae bacterium]HRJ41439.1 carboxylate-amine ligase [Caldilineaceae bacterium]
MKRPSLTIGIEEEYQVVDPESGELRSFITQFIENGKMMMVEREIKPELHQSMVEMGTPVCETPAQAKEELLRQRQFICQLAEDKGLAIVAAATHPFSRWADQQVTPFPRYRGVLEEMQVLAQRLLIFGMHIHIGLDDPDFAIDTMNVVRYMLPHLLALSTSSPFWAGRKTGLKSYRAVIFEDFPRSGIPDVYRNRAEYEGLIRTLVNTGCMPDSSKIWWDVRPHHLYPTLEFRTCDICTRVDEAIAIAALCQAIVLWHWKLRQRNITFRVYRRDLITENKWRAARYGLDGKLIDFGKKTELPARALIREMLELLGEEIDELGIGKEIEPVFRMLEVGTSADRQLRVFDANDGDLKAVVQHLIGETKEGL